jgi:dihydroorotate dehydrogenase electron transfer subunit
MKHFTTTILTNAAVSDSFFELTFAWDAGSSAAEIPRAGQFCTLRVSPYSAPLLRRPFAFSGFDAGRGIASIIYKRRGPATGLLAAKTTGDALDAIGPLGAGFSRMPRYPFASVLCIAGGTGFGPMLFCAQEIIAAGGTARVVLGCRTKSHVPDIAALDALRPVITTDDATAGLGGTPLDYLATLTEEEYRETTVCACGPTPLCRGCHDWSHARGCACYVSLEQVMACGVGACMGCAIKVAGPDGPAYARACTEGPVFDSERIVWI